MNSLGVGTGAVVTVTQTPHQVTATISVPAANHSWGLVRFCGGLTLRQSCTLTRE
jgi:hypothetical protein